MNIWAKALRGDDVRISRFHTESGEPCDASAVTGIVPAAWSWIRHRLTGRYSVLPWWVYGAIGRVERSLRQTDRVLEVGSGYSTLWLASRCSAVCSIEESKAWINIVSDRARELNLRNVELLGGDSRSIFAACNAGRQWDVVVIDGPRDRFEIFRDLMASSSRPRIIVFDDTDKPENRPALNVDCPGYARGSYRGFKPQTLHVCETTVFYRFEG